jgi:hypothetical protein
MASCGCSGVRGNRPPSVQQVVGERKEQSGSVRLALVADWVPPAQAQTKVISDPASAIGCGT